MCVFVSNKLAQEQEDEGDEVVMVPLLNENLNLDDQKCNSQMRLFYVSVLCVETGLASNTTHLNHETKNGIQFACGFLGPRGLGWVSFKAL